MIEEIGGKDVINTVAELSVYLEKLWKPLKVDNFIRWLLEMIDNNLINVNWWLLKSYFDGATDDPSLVIYLYKNDINEEMKLYVKDVMRGFMMEDSTVITSVIKNESQDNDTIYLKMFSDSLNPEEVSKVLQDIKSYLIIASHFIVDAGLVYTYMFQSVKPKILSLIPGQDIYSFLKPKTVEEVFDMLVDYFKDKGVAGDILNTISDIKNEAIQLWDDGKQLFKNGVRTAANFVSGTVSSVGSTIVDFFFL
jgi:hypothetical protein